MEPFVGPEPRNRDVPDLVALPVVLIPGQRRVPVELRDVREVRAARLQGALPLGLVPFELHVDLYTHII